MSTTHNYDHLLIASPLELVEFFNLEVGNAHWTGARGIFLDALRNAFQINGIDYRCVTNYSGGFNLAKGNEVSLEGQRLVLKHDNDLSNQIYKLLQGERMHVPYPKIRHYKAHYASVNCAELLEEYDGLLIFPEHGKQNTFLNLDGVYNCYVMGVRSTPFPNGRPRHYFSSAMYVNGSSNGSFSFLSPAPLNYIISAQYFNTRDRDVVIGEP